MADLNRDGKLDLITLHAASGKLTVFLGVGLGKFAAGVDYPAGSNPTAMVVADLDGDGRSEVLVSDAIKGTVSVLASGSDGSLTLRQTIAAGIAPTLMATGDFNADGKADVALIDAAGNRLSVLLNDGKGNLQKPLVSALLKSPAAIAVADFNNDARADLALANQDGTVSVLLSAGDGQFRAAREIAVSSGPLSAIVAGDFARNGNPGFAVAQSDIGKVSVFSGAGDGSFRASQSYAAGNEPTALLAADVNGDGINDLIAINRGSNTFSVLGGNGDGTFQSSADFVVGKSPLAGVAGDIDGDGRLDIAIINRDSQTISLALGNGDGVFKAARSYHAGLQPRAMASGDLNGDHRPDLVVANYCGLDPACAKGGSIDVFLAGANHEYELSHSYPVGAGPVAVSLLDLDGDGHLDIVALNRQDKTISILMARGDGSFEQPLSLSLAGAPVRLAAGDFNQDGKPDLAVLEDCGSAKCAQPGSVEVLLAADGGLHSAFVYSTGYSPSSIAVGDINGDKHLDILVANRCGRDAGCNASGTATVLIGNVHGSFTAAPDLNLGKAPSSIALADLAGRQKLDLAVSYGADNSVATLAGNGDGSFQAPVAYKAGNAPDSLAIADFDGDGKLDLAVANVDDSTVTVLFGKGDGTLKTPLTIPVGMGPDALLAVTNGSGKGAALITANGNPGAPEPGREVTVLASLEPEGDPTGTAASTVTLTQNPNPSSVNQSVTLTATVTPTGSTIPPTGSVTFNAVPNAIADCNGGTSATVTLNGSSLSVTCQTHSLQALSQTITAVYSGDANYASSSSSPGTQNVTPQAVTFTQAGASPAAPAVNQSITFTAQFTTGKDEVTPNAPTGSVAFTASGSTTPICTGAVSNVNGNIWQAACTTDTLKADSYTVTPSYTGDSNYSVTGATPFTVAVKPVTATLGLGVSPAPYTVGTPVTLTASLKSVALTPTAPTGTVSITVNGIAPAGCTGLSIASGTASCQTTFSIVQSYVVQAVYSGVDANYTIAPSATQTLSVGKAAGATVLLASSLNPSTVNQSVAFTLTVTPPAGATVAPTGTVNFTQGTTTICTAAPLVSNTATCNYAFRQKTAGISIGAVYSGDSNYPKTAATPITQVVEPTNTSTGLASSSNPATVDQAVTFTATVTPAVIPFAGSTAPSGKVSFSFQLNGAPVTISACANAVAVSTTSLVTTAACTAKLTSSGSYSVTAAYSGDGNFNGSASSQLGQTVGAGASTVKLISSPSPSFVDQKVTFTAGVSPAVATPGAPNPTGNVTFSYVQGGTTVTLCSAPQTLSTSGTVTSASCAAPLIAAGTTTVIATYSGDTNYQPSTSPNLSQTVNKTTTSAKLSASITAPVVDEPISFTATIAPAFGGFTGGANPGGTVTFTILEGTNPISAACPNAIPVSTSATFVTTAVCTASLPSTGVYSITANYTGDGNFVAAASSAISETVSISPTTVTIASNLPATSTGGGSVVNQPVTFTAAVVPSFTGPTSPTGKVTFTDSVTGLTLCTETLSSGVAAPCTAAFTTKGIHGITATYNGDGNFSTSKESLQQPVNQAPTTVSVVSSSGATSPTSIATQSVTFTATVNQSYPPGAVPTGTVNFALTQTKTGAADTIDPVCPPAPLNASGQATCVVLFSSAEQSGSVTVTASYAGDANFIQSAGTVAQTIQNFTLGFSTPGPVTIYQGYSNVKDPFSPTPITATTVATGGFNDALTATCVVTNPANPNVAVSDPSCTPTGGPLSSTGTAAYTISASATAPVGTYVVTLTAADAKPPELTHSASFTVIVANTTAALTLGPGASGVAQVIFNTASVPASTTLLPSTIACGTITTVSGTSANIAGQVTCAGSSSSVPVTGDQTTVSVTLTTLAPTSTSTAAKGAGPVAAAAFWGIPLLALLAWFGRRNSPNRSFFRFFGTLLLIVALANVIGCGASYTPPAMPTGGTTPGSYLVQVTITDSNGTKHFAAVPLTVD